MNTITLGDALPDVTLATTAQPALHLPDLKGQFVVLYFYPKDSTPGCTLESKEFRDLQAEFTAANAVIFGISRDSINSHQRFKEKHCLPFELISDPEKVLCDLFDVFKPLTMFGKLLKGIERSTFLFDPSGKLCRQWRKVKPAGHAAEVLAAIK